MGVLRKRLLVYNLREAEKKMQTRKTYVFVLFLDNGKIFNISEKMVINMLKYFSPETKI